jgi:hypothetical protein
VPPGLERREYLLCSTASRTPVVGNLVKAAKVIRGILEVRNLIVEGKLPEGAHYRHERGLARAVLANKESERSETHSLLIAEATEISKCDLVHRL